VSVNGGPHAVGAVPGSYLTLSRRWSSGDTIEISMPFSFRAERTIDDPTVQSIYYGPTLLAVQREPVGEDLESGLIDVDFYRHLKLDGDLAPAMSPTDRPMYFTTGNLTLAPFYVSDPVPPGWEPPEPDPDSPFPGRGRRSPPTAPYHLYVRRREPSVVFGSVEAGVPNSVGPDGLSFLDRVWDRSPFQDYGQFMAVVEETAQEWEAAGELTEGQKAAIVDAARRAEADLQV
jgi:hypothetical protein